MIILSLGFFFLPSCNQQSQDPPSSEQQLMQRGRTVYITQCTTCHNSNPRQEGSLGPALQGSSRELLEARLLRGEYPSGYIPKRPSRVMPPFPHLAAEIEALTAYFNQP